MSETPFKRPKDFAPASLKIYVLGSFGISSLLSSFSRNHEGKCALIHGSWLSIMLRFCVSSAHFGSVRFGNCQLAPRVGFEPTTLQLTAARSTIELPGNKAAEPGFEPGLKDPKSFVLPLHNSALLTAEGRSRTDTGVAPQQFLRLPRLPFRHFGTFSPFRRSRRRDSNSRPLPWQGSVLPLNYFRLTKFYRLLTV